jgi:hypothetical protein
LLTGGLLVQPRVGNRDRDAGRPCRRLVRHRQHVSFRPMALRFGAPARPSRRDTESAYFFRILNIAPSVDCRISTLFCAVEVSARRARVPASGRVYQLRNASRTRRPAGDEAMIVCGQWRRGAGQPDSRGRDERPPTFIGADRPWACRCRRDRRRTFSRARGPGQGEAEIARSGAGELWRPKRRTVRDRGADGRKTCRPI